MAASPSLPQDLAALASEARGFGIRNVGTLIGDWVDGRQRFDRPGESLLVAWQRAEPVGVGGLTRCPDVVGALRVRRFYVATAARRQGVARGLAVRLIESGFEYTRTLTCNAKASAAAGPFWEAMGFQRTEAIGITHIRTRV